MAWDIKFEKRKAFKKRLSEDLIPVAWHPKRSWNFWTSKDDEKEIEPNRVLKRFGTKNDLSIFLSDFFSSQYV